MPYLKRLRRLIAVLAVLLMAAIPTAAQKSDDSETGSFVLMSAIEGPIGPATVRHAGRVIGLAEDRRAAAVILRLNTPGGLADSMREIISQILASDVPVIGYVAPSGAHAASAGTYILYAAHVAAMAPGTNIGAATPVQIGGFSQGLPEDAPGKEGDTDESGKDRDSADEETSKPDSKSLKPDDAMSAKATNDAVALIRSLAELHGRNAEWAERAVREAATLSSDAALKEGVIDIQADDVDELLAAADGRKIEVGGNERILVTAGLPVEIVEMDNITRILSVLSNPNVALVLMMIGIYGLIFEFWNPGAAVPGVVGAISLTLGLYALNQLPFTYAGLALIGLGIAFMVVEALTPTFGILGFGGLVAFILGASMLIDTDQPAYQISWWMIGTMAAISGAVLILLLGFTLRAYRSAPVIGKSYMIDRTAKVLEWSGSEGFVLADGERWHARGGADLVPGQPVRIRDVIGLTLVVEFASESERIG